MRKLLVLLFVYMVVMVSCTSSPNKSADPIEQKVNALLAQMTLEEKIGQMFQSNYWGNPSDWKDQLAKGQIGSFLNLPADPKVVNQIQRMAVEESRLGIPLLVGRDVIHGYKTIFPIPLGMAATWNPNAAKEAMAVAAKEAAATGINWTFAPMIDVTWEPRWGRIAESCGEDPYLATQFAVAMVKGFQGEDPSNPLSIAACAKHYVGYGAAEAGRDYNTTYIPEPLLRNVHLRPFKAAADAGCLTFMSAFNDLNGVPTSGNYFTLKTILRDEWKYDGMVVSDWGSIEEMINHGYCATKKEAAEKAVLAGVDMEMATRCYESLKELLADGKITEELINERVANILRVKFKLGLFENPYIAEDLIEQVTLTPENLELARKVARESMVLLKNNANTLPISKSAKVALVGPLANASRDQLGTWVFDGDENDAITPLTTFSQLLGNNLTYAEGLEYSRDNNTAGFAKAIAAARKSDVVVVLVGEEAALSGEANSRGMLDLPGAQTRLIAELEKTGKPVVVVVMAGRPLAIGAEMDMADAVLYAWHPGTMAGPALADLIFGDYSPSGKLPVTFVKGEGQVPFYYHRKNTGRPADPNNLVLIDQIPRNSKQLSQGFKSMHIDYGVTPLMPFGYGLSYTTFEYGDVVLSSDKMNSNGELTASCTITNTGKMVAEEIVQLYLRDLYASITPPIKELKAFEKITLQPGESKTVSFTIKPEDLKFFDGNDFVLEPGDYNIWIAKDSESGTFKKFELIKAGA